MSDQFLGEIRMFPFTFAPQNWLACDGRLLPISQMTALFSLLGTFYGGDGRSTFALPDMQGSTGISMGISSLGTEYFLGQAGGQEFVTLVQTEMPVHTHAPKASSTTANVNSPSPLRALARTRGGVGYQNSVASLGAMSFQAVSIAGSSLPHNNMMPYLTIGFCIASAGIFPPRN
ncbi:MAG: tail fiber protein [bacterium]